MRASFYTDNSKLYVILVLIQTLQTLKFKYNKNFSSGAYFINSVNIFDVLRFITLILSFQDTSLWFELMSMFSYNFNVELKIEIAADNVEDIYIDLISH